MTQRTPSRRLRSPGEALAWVASLVLALGSFTAWYSVTIDGLQFSVIGWDTGAVGKLVFFVGLAVLAILTLRAVAFDLPPFVVTGPVLAGAGLLATVLVLVRVLAIPGAVQPAGRAVGLWISLGAALVLLSAGLVKAAREV